MEKLSTCKTEVNGEILYCINWRSSTGSQIGLALDLEHAAELQEKLVYLLGPSKERFTPVSDELRNAAKQLYDIMLLVNDDSVIDFTATEVGELCAAIEKYDTVKSTQHEY